MATLTERLPQNATGLWYVDSACIACELCYSLAPELFALHEETGFSIVIRQPVTAAEKALAEEAREACPVEAIGNDGA